MVFHHASLPEISINDIDFLFQNYLNILYDKVNKKLLTESVTQKKIVETYGEILYPGIDKLMTSITLTENDIFIDLGSGKGQITIQFFLKSLVKKAIGIEIVPDLHREAVEASLILQQELPGFYEEGRQLSFVSGSFLEIPFQTATVALINSTCFTQSLLNQLGTILENTPSIHTVFSLRPISTLQRLIFKKVIRVECSWDSALCYLYRAE
jgi:hypothetical protein